MPQVSETNKMANKRMSLAKNPEAQKRGKVPLNNYYCCTIQVGLHNNNCIKKGKGFPLHFKKCFVCFSVVVFLLLSQRK